MNQPSDIPKPHALVIGSRGAIAQALIEQLGETHTVVTLSRQHTDYSEQSLEKLSREYAALGEFDRIVCCTGTLQDSQVSPEKNLKQVSAEGLQHYFEINTILPMLCLKHFHPLLSRHSTSVFACLTALVGSIEDNHLGGWYGYRSSKAALNMLVRNTAIEVGRFNKSARIVAIHPGTTISELSAPFAANVKPGKYYTPNQSASRIIKVMQQQANQSSGGFFNWDGHRLPW